MWDSIKGDLLEMAYNGDLDVLVHGCNCFCKMGAGIAKQIAERYPIAYSIDLLTIKGDKKKLGNYTYVIERNKNKEKFLIVNAYTQFHYGTKFGRVVDYDAIKTVFRKIKNKFHGLRIAYPKIGCGLGGGDWEIVSKIINKELEGEQHFCVIK